jgi:hypothetical protein
MRASLLGALASGVSVPPVFVIAAAKNVDPSPVNSIVLNYPAGLQTDDFLVAIAGQTNSTSAYLWPEGWFNLDTSTTPVRYWAMGASWYEPGQTQVGIALPNASSGRWGAVLAFRGADRLSDDMATDTSSGIANVPTVTPTEDALLIVHGGFESPATANNNLLSASPRPGFVTAADLVLSTTQSLKIFTKSGPGVVVGEPQLGAQFIKSTSGPKPATNIMAFALPLHPA